MKIKNSSPKIKISLCIICTLAFILSVSVLFAVYQRSLNEQFEHMETENLTASALNQSQYVSTLLAGLQGRMSAAAELLSTSSVEPDGEWTADYLEQLCDSYEYSIQYVTAEECYDIATHPSSPAEDMENYEKLMNGECIISSIHYSTHLNDYYFALGHPIQNNGQTTGILRCTVSAKMLLTPTPTSSFYKNSAQCIVDSEGNILYSDHSETWMGTNLLHSLQKRNVVAASIERLRPALKQDHNATVKFKLDHTNYFCSSVSLGYNDWNLVQISKTSTLDAVLQKIFKCTLAVSLAVILLTILIALLVFRIIIKQQQKIQLEEARYAALSNFTDTILFEYDAKSDQLQLTPNAIQLLAIDTTTFEHFMIHDFQALHFADMMPLKKMMTSCLNNTKPQSLEIRLLQKDRQWLWCECQVQPVTTDGTIIKLMGKLSDISGRKAKELELLKQTKTDPLTGLLNVEGIRSAVDNKLTQSKLGFLFMMDVDNFKAVNDTYGHGTGDQILKEVGKLLHQSFREHDPVGRIGGDEFIAFLGDTCSKEIAQMKGELLIQRFSELKISSTPHISISIGIAGCPASGSSYDALYKAADTAMYKAKSQGKNQFYFCETPHSKT